MCTGKTHWVNLHNSGLCYQIGLARGLFKEGDTREEIEGGLGVLLSIKINPKTLSLPFFWQLIMHCPQYF